MAAVCCWCGGACVKARLEGIEMEPAWWCGTASCQVRQLNHAVSGRKKKGREVCVNVPLPKQVEFRERPERYVLFGGAAGPGKSHEARWALYEKCLTVPGFEALLLRETFGELERTHMRRMEEEQSLVDSAFVPSAHVMRFSNRSL